MVKYGLYDGIVTSMITNRASPEPREPLSEHVTFFGHGEKTDVRRK